MASAGAKTEYELERDRRIAENKRKMEVCGGSRGRQRRTQLHNNDTDHLICCCFAGLPLCPAGAGGG